jgi:hypothetical protein
MKKKYMRTVAGRNSSFSKLGTRIGQEETSVKGVNDTHGHSTCSVCTLKSHFLQIKLTDHTTCKYVQPWSQNGSLAGFLPKKNPTFFPQATMT